MAERVFGMGDGDYHCCYDAWMGVKNRQILEKHSEAFERGCPALLGERDTSLGIPIYLVIMERMIKKGHEASTLRLLSRSKRS